LRQEVKAEQDRTDAIRRLDVFVQNHIYLQKIFFIKKLECSAKESQVRENFAVKLRDINQKKMLLLILADNVKAAKLRSKLVQNFCKLLTPIVDRRILVSAHFGFRNIKDFKPRPFHRTNLRAEKAIKNTTHLEKKCEER